jgi:alpha-1,6-mannosyltransferase
MPAHTWADENDTLLDLRHLPDHLGLGLALAFAGLVLLTWAWWSLRGRVAGRPDGVRQVRLATAAWAAPLLIAPPLFSGDGWSYVATGYLTGHGLSPYVATPSVLPIPLKAAVNHQWLTTPSPYGPLPLVWGGAFSRITADPWVLLASYRLLAVVGLVLVAWAVPLLARRAGKDPADASALVVASPLVLAHGIGGLHNDLIMVGLMMAALVVTRRDRWLLGAALAGAAAAVKVPGGLIAVGVVLLSLGPAAGLLARVRRTAAVGAVSVGTLLLTGVVSGLGIGWLQGLAVPVGTRSHLAPMVNAGHLLADILYVFGDAGVALVHQVHPVVIAKAAGVLVLGVLIAWALLRRRLDTDARALGGAALVLLAATLLSPVVHYWYFLWCLPLLACIPLSRAGLAAVGAGVTALGVTAIADPSLHVAWLSSSAVYAITLLPPLAWAASRLLARRAEGPPTAPEPAQHVPST